MSLQEEYGWRSFMESYEDTIPNPTGSGPVQRAFRLCIPDEVTDTGSSTLDDLEVIPYTDSLDLTASNNSVGQSGLMFACLDSVYLEEVAKPFESKSAGVRCFERLPAPLQEGYLCLRDAAPSEPVLQEVIRKMNAWELPPYEAATMEGIPRKYLEVLRREGTVSKERGVEILLEMIKAITSTDAALSNGRERARWATR